LRPAFGGREIPRARGSVLIDFLAENVLKTYCRMWEENMKHTTAFFATVAAVALLSHATPAST
jgi:hypothetical protein